ncbi:MAG TPA: hypothetical protein VHE99_11180 [Gammaproteobacteria bacterium]|nr:hypothetical protein [Gammaproteobacteria bacterium]
MMKEIDLTKEEYDFLLKNNFLENDLRRLLENIESGYRLKIDDLKADEIRDQCGEYLQIVGFDKNYNPTPEGKILEKLIDKFYIG